MAKVSVSLPASELEMLKAIAEEQEISLSMALRQTIADQKFLRAEVNKGARVLLERDGVTHQILLR